MKLAIKILLEAGNMDRGYDQAKDYWKHYNSYPTHNVGAGVLPICSTTKRCLVGLRSADVNTPHTWGAFGGTIDEGESPAIGAKREFIEETNFSGNIKLIPAYVFHNQAKGYTYHNFIGIIENEFRPHINWEFDDLRWVNLDDLIRLNPKHYGLSALMQKSANIIKQYMV
jgi:8-oxo-dGTP pyrophosphatase MutT (NUDIX family)